MPSPGERIFQDADIMGRVYSWVAEKRDLVTCMAITRAGLSLAAEYLFAEVKENRKIAVDLVKAGCPLDRYTLYVKSVKSVVLIDSVEQQQVRGYRPEFPSSKIIARLRGQYPNLSRLEFCLEEGPQNDGTMALSFSSIVLYKEKEKKERPASGFQSLLGEVHMVMPERSTRSGINGLLGDVVGLFRRFSMRSLEARPYGTSRIAALVSTDVSFRAHVNKVESLSVEFYGDISNLRIILDAMPKLVKLNVAVRSHSGGSGLHQELAETVAGCPACQGGRLKELIVRDPSVDAEVTDTLDIYKLVVGLECLSYPLDLTEVVGRYLWRGIPCIRTDEVQQPWSEAVFGSANKESPRQVHLLLVAACKALTPLAAATVLLQAYAPAVELTLEAAAPDEALSVWIRHVNTIRQSLIRTTFRYSPPSLGESAAGIGPSPRISIPHSRTGRGRPVQTSTLAASGDGEPVGQKVFENVLIMHEICSWVKLDGTRGLLHCMLANSAGFATAAGVLYREVEQDMIVRLAQSGCCLVGLYISFTSRTVHNHTQLAQERLNQYILMVRAVVLDDHRHISPSLARIKAQYPRVNTIKASGVTSLDKTRNTGSVYISLIQPSAQNIRSSSGGQTLGDLEYTCGTEEPLAWLFGLTDKAQPFRLTAIHMPKAVSRSSELAQRLLAAGSPVPIDLAARSAFSAVKRLTAPTTIFAANLMLADILPLFPALEYLTVLSAPFLTAAAHQRDLITWLSAAKYGANPHLCGIHILYDNANGYWNANLEDFLSIRGIQDVAGPFNFSSIVSNFIENGQYGPAPSDIVKPAMQLEGFGQRLTCLVRKCDTKLNPYPIASWLAQRGSDAVPLTLEAQDTDKEVLTWIRSIRDMHTALLRSAYDAGTKGYELRWKPKPERKKSSRTGRPKRLLIVEEDCPSALDEGGVSLTHRKVD